MSTVVVTFESADGSKQEEVGWPVNDLADYEVSVANGLHDLMIEEALPMVRRKLQDDHVRVISTTVDGVPQPLTDRW